jgi:hypothetical protein
MVCKAGQDHFAGKGAKPRSTQGIEKNPRGKPGGYTPIKSLVALHVTNGIAEEELNKLLGNSNPYIRSWAIQLLTEDKKVSPATLELFLDLAQNDSSALVRLYLLSGLQRIRPEQRWEIVEALVQKPGDAADHNIPMMLWYASEPLVTLDMERALKMAEDAKIPKLLEFTILRLGTVKSAASNALLSELKARLQKETSNQSAFYRAKIDSVLVDKGV